MNIENELDNIWKVIHEFEFRIENQRASLKKLNLTSLASIKKHQEKIDDAKTAMHFLREILGLESEVEKAKREERESNE